MFFQYGRWKDGHIGVEITFPKNRLINTFVYEGLGTKDQTGPMLYDSFWGEFEEQISAKDNSTTITFIKDGNIGEWE